MHQNLILNTAGSIGRQLDILGGLIGADRFDKPDGTDGNQVLNIDARVLKTPGDIHHKAEFALDKLCFCLLASLPHAGNQSAFLSPVQRRRNEIANSTYDAMAADAAARGRELNDTNKQGVSIVADACRSDYASYVSIPLASQLNLLIGKLQNILWIVLLASVLFCALAIYLTVSLSGGRKTAYRCLFFALTASALLCLLIAAALNPMLRMENLNLEPASLRLFLASYVRGVFESFGIFAAVYGAASALFLFLSRGKMVRDPAGRAKKVHRKPLLNRL